MDLSGYTRQLTTNQREAAKLLPAWFRLYLAAEVGSPITVGHAKTIWPRIKTAALTAKAGLDAGDLTLSGSPEEYETLYSLTDKGQKKLYAFVDILNEVAYFNRRQAAEWLMESPKERRHAFPRWVSILLPWGLRPGLTVGDQYKGWLSPSIALYNLRTAQKLERVKDCDLSKLSSTTALSQRGLNDLRRYFEDMQQFVEAAT